MEIYLIRHTKVNIPPEVCYGFSDLDVSDNFETEIEKIFRKIKIDKSYIVYSSPLQRCLKLAKKINQDEIIIDDNLKEINFGDWELKKWDEIPKLDFEKWSNNYVKDPCPSGESFLDLSKRALAFYNSAIINNKNFIVVTHAGVIRSILANLLEIPLNNALKIRIDFGSVTKISINKALTTIDFINL